MPISLYFLAARYFQIWAKIVLKKWNPIIIAVVGSAGKTSTMYLIDQILKGQKVKVTHHANAATSIPLNILNIKQESYSVIEWVQLFFKAPIQAFKIKHEESIYLCEMDSDRVGEMQIHTRLIKPHITCWTSAFATHTQNFPGKTREEIMQSMAEDVGFAVERNMGLILANGDDKLLASQLKRSLSPSGLVSIDKNDQAIMSLNSHGINLSGTRVSFRLNIKEFASLYERFYPHKQYNEKDFPSVISLEFPYAIMSEINMYGVGIAVLTGLLLGFNKKQITNQLKAWRLPPGRMSIFAGIKATTIIDSSYNSSRQPACDAIKTLAKLGDHKTIAVLGDMRELGDLSRSEHIKLAQEIVKAKIRRVILIGPAMTEHAYPYLLEKGYKENRTIFKTNDPQWAADLIKSEDFLRTGETILVKGSQNTLFLEGLVEQILASAKDKKHLCRREAMWEKKRSLIYK